MLKTIIVGAAMLAFGAVALSSAHADDPSSRAQSSTSAVGASDAAEKTSDRTPGDMAPNRTQGASRSGAAGTDAARTSEGTSDRTPGNQATMSDVAPTGRNSQFTEDQARAHLAHLGYSNISELTKNENGAWLGSAVKDGKTVMVGVDIKGNVAIN